MRRKPEIADQGVPFLTVPGADRGVASWVLVLWIPKYWRFSSRGCRTEENVITDNQRVLEQFRMDHPS